MLWIPGGEFLMGSDNAYPEEAPAHRVRVRTFCPRPHCNIAQVIDFQRLLSA